MARRICIYYAQGHCHRGAACTDKHDKSSNVPVSSKNANDPKKFKTVVCKFYGEGTCKKGDDCPFIHPEGENGDSDSSDNGNGISRIQHQAAPKSPTSAKKIFVPPGVCREFHTNGRCYFGVTCRFAHQGRDDDEVSRLLTTNVNTPSTTEAGQGRFFPKIGSRPQAGANFTDALLPPTKILAYTKIQAALQKASRTSGAMAVGDAESMLLAFLGSNEDNLAMSEADREAQLVFIANDETEPRRKLVRTMSWPVITLTGLEPGSMSFASCWMGWIAYYTYKAVIKSVSIKAVSAMYALMNDNLDHIMQVIETNLSSMIAKKSFAPKTSVAYGRTPVLKLLSGVQVFYSIAVLFMEYLSHFQVHAATNRHILIFAHSLRDHFDHWKELLTTHGSGVVDALKELDKDNRDNFITVAGPKYSNFGEVQAPTQLANGMTILGGRKQPALGVVAFLDREYVGPGILRPEGQRHDNDHVEFSKIKAAPTTDELLSTVRPYCPPTIPKIRHHLPADSMEKILDIQYRLLRLDAISPLIRGIQSILKDLDAKDFDRTTAGRLVRTRGGVYKATYDDNDSIMLPLITGIHFTGFHLDRKYGTVIHVSGDPPPGRARAAGEHSRQAYWNGGKRLTSGDLVAVLTKPRHAAATASLAILVSSPGGSPNPKQASKDKAKYGSTTAKTLHFSLAYVESQDAMVAAAVMRRPDHHEDDIRIIVESPVLWESIRPFLEALQRTNPITMPLADYIRHADPVNIDVQPPAYALEPGFTWDLTVLLKDHAEGRDASEALIMNPRDANSVAVARERLAIEGKLDPSQSEAVVDVMMRELALVQGPPGTGKTFTGVELLRLLFANKIGPIVLLATTNHALDHILFDVHERGIARDIIRLGSRSKNEIIKQYNLDELERIGNLDAPNSIAINKLYRELKLLEDVRQISLRRPPMS